MAAIVGKKKEEDILCNWEALPNNAANHNFKWGHRCWLPKSLPVWQLLVHWCWWTVHAIKELITIIPFVGSPGTSQELQGHPCCLPQLITVALDSIPVLEIENGR